MSCRDLLLMDKINALPQPLLVSFSSKDNYWWPVESIDVSGCMRIDVCGLLEVKHFAEVMRLQDGEHVAHNPEDFYNEDDNTQPTDGARNEE